MGQLITYKRATEQETNIPAYEDPYNFNKIFNNGGLGPQSMSYVDHS